MLPHRDYLLESWRLVNALGDSANRTRELAHAVDEEWAWDLHYSILAAWTAAKVKRREVFL